MGGAAARAPLVIVQGAFGRGVKVGKTRRGVGRARPRVMPVDTVTALPKGPVRPTLLGEGKTGSWGAAR